MGFYLHARHIASTKMLISTEQPSLLLFPDILLTAPRGLLYSWRCPKSSTKRFPDVSHTNEAFFLELLASPLVIIPSLCFQGSFFAVHFLLLMGLAVHAVEGRRLKSINDKNVRGKQVAVIPEKVGRHPEPLRSLQPVQVKASQGTRPQAPQVFSLPRRLGLRVKHTLGLSCSWTSLPPVWNSDFSDLETDSLKLLF